MYLKRIPWIHLAVEIYWGTIRIPENYNKNNINILEYNTANCKNVLF